MQLFDPLHRLFKSLGEEGITQLTAAFYKQVRQDDLLAPMYPAQDFDAAEARLRDFLLYRFGGPQNYIEQRGHPRLRARHAPFAINTKARDRWLQLMGQAMVQTNVSEEDAEQLHPFFEQVATFMINQGEE